MLLAVLAVVIGLILLVWSADKFVDGAASTAYRLGMSPLLVGMVIVGFGTSAPEIVVSAFASAQGNPGLALGNAIGSNISNIALILGVTALICPIVVHSSIVKREIPILIGVSAVLWFLAANQMLELLDGIILLVLFAGIMGWSIYTATKKKEDPLSDEFDESLDVPKKSLRYGIIWLIVGFIFLVISSRMLVWGAVSIAIALGVSDLIVGLTVVAIGTSLPELASSIAATRKGEHDIALGNVVGSNLFNTLGVVGLAAVIKPFEIESIALTRDFPVMSGLTLLLFLLCFGFKGQGKIKHWEGGLLTATYIGYTILVVVAAIQHAGA
ncbi:MAG: calcium/sodium antiporter [Opitutales bacterium]|nr:calcium/sodium antiporter [Opitutales bacterium]